jgi:LPXTG-motif cell wall-anchored protein
VIRFFGWLIVQAALVALAINLGRDQGQEWGAFLGIIGLGGGGLGFWRFTAGYDYEL